MRIIHQKWRPIRFFFIKSLSKFVFCVYEYIKNCTILYRAFYTTLYEQKSRKKVNKL